MMMQILEPRLPTFRPIKNLLRLRHPGSRTGPPARKALKLTVSSAENVFGKLIRHSNGSPRLMRDDRKAHLRGNWFDYFSFRFWHFIAHRLLGQVGLMLEKSFTAVLCASAISALNPLVHGPNMNSQIAK